MKQIISVIYYECPVCGRNSINRKEIARHFREHQIKTDEVIYCKICGAGWHVNAYGKIRAEEKAKECYKKHIETGDADKVATEAFFLSKGAFGYVRVNDKTGGGEDEDKGNGAT